MPNTSKKGADHCKRRNISISPRDELIALKLMDGRGRGTNFRRFINDLIHEEQFRAGRRQEKT
jgi:hypothetical protein